jgi:hypothetical protein
MPTARYTPEWVVPNAGPAFSVMHFEASNPGGLQASINALRAFMASWAAYLPDDVSITFPAEAILIDETTGQMVGSQSIAPPAGFTGGVSGVWAGGAGFRIDWQTGQIYNGRRLRGRTFVVPAAAAAFGAGGLVAGAVRTAIGTSAATFIAATQNAGCPLRIYRRPKVDDIGSGGNVTAGTVPALAATLRERKS